MAKRSEERINKNAVGGDLEVQVQEWKLLNACAPLPFTLTANNGGIEVIREDLRAKYRYLDLRVNQSLQKNLQKRNDVTREIRAFLH
jgi:aspartyl-tRNA synthetase